LIAWGDKDPWEPIEMGRNYGNFDSVEDFIVLPNVGHCPQVLSFIPFACFLSIIYVCVCVCERVDLAFSCDDYFPATFTFCDVIVVTRICSNRN
jgi:hypothetical protein